MRALVRLRWLFLGLLPLPAFAQQRLTLDEAVRRAVLRNSTALVARQEILRAEGVLREVRAPALPALAGNAAGTQVDAARRSGGTLVQGQSSLSANLMLSLALIAPARWAAWAHAGDQAAIARLSAEEVGRGVAVATARAYLAVMAQHRLVQIDSQASESAKAHLADSRARFEAGTGNRLDVVRAGQELATDESNIAAAQANLTRAMEALGVLVGEEGPVEVTEQIALPEPLRAPDQALMDAEELRPDVRAQKARAEAARRVLRDSYTDYLPLLTASVEPFFQHPSTLTQPHTGWQAQLLLTVPFYDGGARYGLRRERSALYEESKAQLTGLLLQARSDVRTAFEEVRRADEGLLAARESARLAHEALDLTNLSYREGAIRDLEVVDAERIARDADTAALSAEDASRQARIDLLAASGHFP